MLRIPASSYIRQIAPWCEKFAECIKPGIRVTTRQLVGDKLLATRCVAETFVGGGGGIHVTMRLGSATQRCTHSWW